MASQIDHIIVKVLENSASEKEKLQLLQWIQSYKKHQSHFEEMVKTWEKTTMFLVNEEEMEKRFARFERSARKVKIISNLRRCAASVAILLVCALAVKFVFFNPKEVIYVTVMTDENKKSFLLPDSTLVWLNANSVLKYPETFAKKKREVHLVGEALFDVKKEPKRGFCLKTNKMQVEVIGTRFLVNEYPYAHESEVVLVSGEVALKINKESQASHLKPNQRAKYNYNSMIVDIEDVDVANYTNWTNERLVFDNTLFEDVLMQLEKWYNLHFICENRALKRVAISFVVDQESKEEVLSTLQLIVPFTYQEVDGAVVIR